MRAQLLNALAGLSEAEGELLDTLQRSPVDGVHRFGLVRKWANNALNVTERYYDELVEAPGLGINLGAILELVYPDRDGEPLGDVLDEILEEDDELLETLGP
jgi:hypothetical protein